MSVLSQSESSQHAPHQSYLALMANERAGQADMQTGPASTAAPCNYNGTGPHRNGLLSDGNNDTDEGDDHMREHEHEDMREAEDKSDEDGDDSDTNTKRTGGSKARKPHLQGRFSGRLETKADEKRLADECKLLGHLLGGTGKRGEKSRLTLAKIVRGIASGDVRRYCEQREQLIQNLKQQVKGWEQNSPSHMQVDADSKMPGFDQERQQLANAMAGSMTLASNSLATGHTLTGVASPVVVQVPTVSAVHAVTLPAPSLPGSAVTAVGAAGAKQELRQQQQQSQQAAQPGALVISNGLEGHAMQSVASPKLAQAAQAAPQPSSSGMNPQAAQEAHALANASETLKAQAQTLKAHAENLHAQSFQTVSQPAHMQASVKAQSLATHAQSLEAQAEAQNLQAQAHVHAHAHAEAQAQAQHLAAQAQAHAQAQATANAHATHLKSAASYGQGEAQEAQQVAVHAHNLEAQAHAHAEAQIQAAVQAHSLAAKAQAHAHAQAQAQAQAQNMAFQAHNLQAHAQQLEVESAHPVSSHINVGLQHQLDQVPAQKGLVAQQQPTAVSQLVPLPPAQQLNPLPAAAVAAAVAPGPPQLSVQTSLKLQSQPPLLQPDLTTQLHHTPPHPLPAQANNNLARGMVGQIAPPPLSRGSPPNHMLFAHPATSGLHTSANPSTVFLLTSSAPDPVSFPQGGVHSPRFLTQFPPQAQTTVLQQQPNGLLIQPQALSNQLGAQPSVVHHQLSSHQIDTLQQQVQESLQQNHALQQQHQQQQQAQQQQQQQQAQQGLLQMPTALEGQMSLQQSADLHNQMMQPESLAQLSAHNTNTIANALGLPSAMGLNPTDSAHAPSGSNIS